MLIGIVHHDSTEKFLRPLLKSMEGVRQKICIVHNNKENPKGVPALSQLTWKKEHYLLFNPRGGYELGALAALADAFPKERDFFLLHSTTLIKKHELFDIAEQFDGSLAICPGFGSFMGKYRRKVLEEIGIPRPQSLKAAIYYEYFWNIMYMDLEKKIASIDEPLEDTQNFEMKFGKERMVLENSYLKKWKSNHSGFKIKIPV